jgi:hypothetical protein
VRGARALEQAQSLSQALHLLLGRRNSRAGPSRRHRAMAADHHRSYIRGQEGAISDGIRESAQSWRELLLDVKRAWAVDWHQARVRRWRARILANGEGRLAQTRFQRCRVPKIANVLNKLPNNQQPKAKRALQGIWMGETKTMGLPPSTPSSRPGASNTKGGRVPDQVSRRPARLLRLPGRALEASAHDG